MARLTRSQQLRRYRSLYAKAKAKGLVKGDKDARSLEPSGYMKTKLNKLDPYLSSDYTALKVEKSVAKLYKDNPSGIVPAVSNGRVLVRNEPGYRAMVKRGIPRRIRKLKHGEHEFVPLPIKPSSPQDLLDIADTNPVLNQLKYEDELFAFRIKGYESYGMFPDLQSLAWALMRYEILDPKKEIPGEDPEKNFETLEVFRSHPSNWSWDHKRVERRRKAAQRRQQNRMRRMSKEERLDYLADIAEKRKRSDSYQRQIEKQRAKRASMTDAELEAERVKARERMARKRAKQREQN